MNKKMWGGETRPNYVAPSFEEFNVAVEEGFATTGANDWIDNPNVNDENSWMPYGDTSLDIE